MVQRKEKLLTKHHASEKGKTAEEVSSLPPKKGTLLVKCQVPHI